MTYGEVGTASSAIDSVVQPEPQMGTRQSMHSLAPFMNEDMVLGAIQNPGRRHAGTVEAEQGRETTTVSLTRDLHDKVET